MFTTITNLRNSSAMQSRVDSIESELTQIYFDMCNNVNPDVAPKDLNQFTSHLGDPWTLVKVRKTRDEPRNKEHGSTYWWNIAEIKEIGSV